MNQTNLEESKLRSLMAAGRVRVSSLWERHFGETPQVPADGPAPASLRAALKELSGFKIKVHEVGREKWGI